MRSKKGLFAACAIAAVAGMPVVLLAEASADAPPSLFSLTSQDTESTSSSSSTTTTTTTTTTTMTTMVMTSNWDVEGPVRMRGFDIQDVGTLDWKNTFGWSTASDGTDDDVSYRMQLQYGLHESHELDLYLPVNIGDGDNAGNLDVSVGWQWNMFSDDMLSFGLYNEVRLPTGTRSSGLDWEMRGIFTHVIQPDQWRLHVNPFIKFVDGDNVETAQRDGLSGPTHLRNSPRIRGSRHFQWGVILGTDYALSDQVVMNLDYVMDSGVLNGGRLQHEIELGLDYQIAVDQSLNVAGRVGIDGDDQGDNWGLALSWVWTIDDVGRPVVGWER